MNDSKEQFHFIHMLLPLFPSQTRMLFLCLLYFLEIMHLYDEFKEEAEALSSAPDCDEFPDMETIIEMMMREGANDRPSPPPMNMNPDMLMKMLSPKQREMFDKYQNLFSE